MCSRKQLNQGFNLSDTRSYNRKRGRDQNWKGNRSEEMLNCLEIDDRTLRVDSRTGFLQSMEGGVDHPYSWPVECSNDREKLGQLQLVVDQEQ